MPGEKDGALIAQINTLERRLFPKAQSWQGGLAAELTRPGSSLSVAIVPTSRQVLGFLVCRVQQLAVHLAYLAVLPSHRRRGLARRLVQVQLE